MSENETENNTEEYTGPRPAHGVDNPVADAVADESAEVAPSAAGDDVETPAEPEAAYPNPEQATPEDLENVDGSDNA